ncbi:hypothetical protein [Treponema zioleckii]|uniref:hypothetical protein n=1 Tax=Treponema zioleckii TaxID=331680 RepID=UPI00168B5A1A|nr:hypothetical protein [Treponema zioleckii]
MNFSGFEYYCETPDVGLSGKGKSYKNAIQYLCDFLRISTFSFSSKDLEIIKSKEYDVSSTNSEFYKELMKYLTANGRSSYLRSGFIKSCITIFL